MTIEKERGPTWLELLVAQHSAAVLRYARRRVPPDEVDDVVAEVFATAWQHRGRVPEQALPWLYRTASHHVLHVHRGAGRRDRLALRLAGRVETTSESQDHAEMVASAVDDGERVRSALLQLSPRDAEILRLSAWEQLGEEDLAYVLGCTRPAARVRLHRARRRLAAVLHLPVDDVGKEVSPWART